MYDISIHIYIYDYTYIYIHHVLPNVNWGSYDDFVHFETTRSLCAL